MKFSRAKFIYSTLALISLLTGCKHEEPKARIAINTFSMQVNGQIWTPFQSQTDPCASTYAGAYADLGTIPIYTIYAYRDPSGRTDADSENLLRIRVMNVTEPGIYLLDGTYKEDFDSYIIFQMQNPYRRYVNNPGRSPFVVYVTEITTKRLHTIPGIKGSFSGILYNEDNLSDSLIIDKGKFAFDIMGGGFDSHCGF